MWYLPWLHVVQGVDRLLPRDFLPLVLLLAMVPQVRAEEAPEDLAARIARLERRLAELEGRAPPEPAPQAAPPPAERLSAVPDSPWFTPGADLRLATSWDYGLQGQTAKRDFRVHVGGRFDWDVGWVNAPADAASFLPPGTGSLNDGSAFRRARVRVDGRMYQNIDWVIEFDFSEGNARLFDLFVDVTRLPGLGSVRMGYFREPISLESLSSANFLTFLERGSIRDALNPIRSPGIMAFNHAWDQQITWAVGGFFANAIEANALESLDGDYAATGRLTWNPIYQDNGETVVHLGGSYSFRNLARANIRDGFLYAATPELRFGLPPTVSTGQLFGDHAQLFEGECLLVLGPFSVQAEFLGSLTANTRRTADAAGTDAFFYGWFVQASYFLTGEHRPYRRDVALMDRVIPKQNFLTTGGDCPAIVGWGAWELAVRYSSLHLDSLPRVGGTMNNVTLGLNWHWNPNCKVQWNYVLSMLDAAHRGGESGLLHLFAMRVHIDF